MFTNPKHSRVVLINPSRKDPASVPADVTMQRTEGLTLLSAAHELFGVAVDVIGEGPSAGVPGILRPIAAALDVESLFLWSDERFTALLAASDAGAIFLGGAWLDEDLVMVALEGVRRGYDVRVLADLSIARRQEDRLLVLDRLALHGVLPMTMRQALLEWALCLDDPALKRKVQHLLA